MADPVIELWLGLHSGDIEIEREWYRRMPVMFVMREPRFIENVYAVVFGPVPSGKKHAAHFDHFGVYLSSRGPSLFFDGPLGRPIDIQYPDFFSLGPGGITWRIRRGE